MTQDEIKALPQGERLDALKDVMGTMKCKGVYSTKQDSYNWKRKQRNRMIARGLRNYAY